MAPLTGFTGARAYYMHFVLHDWPDAKCRIILQQLMAAMSADYSLLLLNESVMPERNAPSWFAAADINMMSKMAGITRTETQWMELLQSVGLEAVKVWLSPHANDSEGVIVARLRE